MLSLAVIASMAADELTTARFTVPDRRIASPGAITAAWAAANDMRSAAATKGRTGGTSAKRWQSRRILPAPSSRHNECGLFSDASEKGTAGLERR